MDINIALTLTFLIKNTAHSACNSKGKIYPGFLLQLYHLTYFELQLGDSNS